MRRVTKLAVLAAALILPLSIAACSSDDKGTTGTTMLSRWA